MFRALISAFLVFAIGCSSAKTESPEIRKEKKDSLDHRDLKSSPTTIFKAATMPWYLVYQRLGAYELELSSESTIERGKEKETVKQSLRLRYDERGNFQLIKNTSKAYGLEIRHVDGQLYIKRRYGKFYQRSPQDPNEVNELIDKTANLFSAYLRLVAQRFDIRPIKEVYEAKRSIIQYDILRNEKLKSKPRYRQRAKLWRNTLEVDRLKGKLELDKKTSVPLKLSLTTRYRFSAAKDLPRSGLPKEFSSDKVQVSINYAHQLKKLVSAKPIDKPSKNELIDIRRRRLELERQMIKGEHPLDPNWKEKWGDIER